MLLAAKLGISPGLINLRGLYPFGVKVAALQKWKRSFVVRANYATLRDCPNATMCSSSNSGSLTFAARRSRGVLFPASGSRAIAMCRMAGRSRSCPYGLDNVECAPFDALYNVVSAPSQVGQQGQGSSAAVAAGPPQTHGILVSFADGTAATEGPVSVTNGSTNSTVTKPLPANSTGQQCMEVLQQAAFQAGLQIQAQPDGGLRLFGTNNAVNVTQASISVSQF
jgi:hypothetical protein